MKNKQLEKATILFVDIVDSIELANYWDVDRYNDFINEFQFKMLSGIALWKHDIREIELSGDELVVFFVSKKNTTRDVIDALDLATFLKILWYTTNTNRKRIKEGKKILDLGVGISTGKVMLDNRPYKQSIKKLIDKRKTLEGFAISLAKRIENFSRQGKYSRIMLGHSSITELSKVHHHYEFEYHGLQKLKGLAQEIPIFELKSTYFEGAEGIAVRADLSWVTRILNSLK
jgi:class 3 adenylate cyclase